MYEVTVPINTYKENATLTVDVNFEMESSIPPIQINVKKGRSWNTSTSISNGFLEGPKSFTIDPNAANEGTMIITAVPFNGILVDFSFTY